MPPANSDYNTVLTNFLKKQIAILGPGITLSKARTVEGITITEDGSVTDIKGDPKEITKKLVAQFMELSGLIVKNAMEPLEKATTPTIETSPVQNTTPEEKLS